LSIPDSECAIPVGEAVECYLSVETVRAPPGDVDTVAVNVPGTTTSRQAGVSVMVMVPSVRHSSRIQIAPVPRGGAIKTEQPKGTDHFFFLKAPINRQ